LSPGGQGWGGDLREWLRGFLLVLRPKVPITLVPIAFEPLFGRNEEGRFDMFFNVKPGDRVRQAHPNPNVPGNGRVGVCERTCGMLVFVKWDGETEESHINAAFLEQGIRCPACEPRNPEESDAPHICEGGC
jgi:hypothetical protein